MRVPLLLAALWFGFSWPAAAQLDNGWLTNRLRSVDPKTTTKADCAAQVAKAASLNGPDLFYGATVCYAADQAVDGNFLMIAAQTRSMVDMRLMVPATKADSDVMMSLYGFIYFQAGGPGKEEVLRNPASRDALFSLFERWSPSFSPDYHPGWAIRRGPDGATYQSTLAKAKAHRRQQLAEVAVLYSDATYDGLNRRLQDLKGRNPKGFVSGTPDAMLSSDLMRQMNERAVALGIERPKPVSPSVDTSKSQDRFPPDTPEKDEVVITASSDPVVQQCRDQVERITIAAESKVVRVLITTSRSWGVIWRADIEGSNKALERFTCTRNTTSSRPLEMGKEGIPPLTTVNPSAAP